MFTAAIYISSVTTTHLGRPFLIRVVLLLVVNLNVDQYLTNSI